MCVMDKQVLVRGGDIILLSALLKKYLLIFLEFFKCSIKSGQGVLILSILLYDIETFKE
jgi:hypothetical protein